MQATWPTDLRLRGFPYDTLESDQIGIRDRLRWLTRDADDYTPQIYDQLATCYWRAGDTEAARRWAGQAMSAQKYGYPPVSAWLGLVRLKWNGQCVPPRPVVVARSNRSGCATWR